VPDTRLGRLKAIRHVRAAIREFRPDVVHSSLFEADLASRLAATGTGTPVICSLVNTGYSDEAVATEPVSAGKLRLAKALDGLLARHATTAFHAISEATATHAVEHLRVPRSRIRVVPRGRDAALFGERTRQQRGHLREQLGWAERPVVLNVARQEPQKGLELLLRAFSRVIVTHPDALLVQVGREGRSTGAIRELVERLDLGDSVRFFGVRSDIPELLTGADIFGFSSLWEGLGGAVVEAAAASLPIVAFDIPAIREIVGPDHPWLVPVGDVDALGEAMIQVIDSDSETARHFAAEERRRFLDRYELGAAVQGMVELYRDVFDDTRGRTVGVARRIPAAHRPLDQTGKRGS
jgi:glycosyltransferase involved in cell wall biosynthesis